jgi:hypothetical protein
MTDPKPPTEGDEPQEADQWYQGPDEWHLKWYERTLYQLLLFVVGIILFSLVLFLMLDWYIAPQTSTQKKDLMQAFALIMGGIVATVVIFFVWRGQRLTQQVQEANQQNIQEQLRMQQGTEEQLRMPQSAMERRGRETKGNIFISYRRDEGAGYAGRIADRFVERFGEDAVFHDLDSLEPGLDFAEGIERAVNASEVLVAVMGKNWVTTTDEAGRRRLENADDWVRLEIAAALQRNIRVIPLLVQGAPMPRADELPDDLAPLARRHAFELHDSSWKDDLQRFINTVERVIAK